MTRISSTLAGSKTQKLGNLGCFFVFFRFFTCFSPVGSMVYLPTFTIQYQPNVGKYTIRWVSWRDETEGKTNNWGHERQSLVELDWIDVWFPVVGYQSKHVSSLGVLAEKQQLYVFEVALCTTITWHVYICKTTNAMINTCTYANNFCMCLFPDGLLLTVNLRLI